MCHNHSSNGVIFVEFSSLSIVSRVFALQLMQQTLTVYIFVRYERDKLYLLHGSNEQKLLKITLIFFLSFLGQYHVCHVTISNHNFASKFHKQSCQFHYLLQINIFHQTTALISGGLRWVLNYKDAFAKWRLSKLSTFNLESYILNCRQVLIWSKQ